MGVYHVLDAYDFGEKWTLTGHACQEATTLIRRLADKAQRKANEAEQKLKAFCKRHGIENVDEYVKIPKE